MSFGNYFFRIKAVKKALNDENAHVPFSIILKSVLMFTNAQDMCQIIYRNVQDL